MPQTTLKPVSGYIHKLEKLESLGKSIVKVNEGIS
jgi:hypothetical protein